MHAVTLAHPTDVEGWRAAARSLRLAEVPPERITWRIGEEDGGLFDGGPPPPAPEGAAFSAPRDLIPLAEAVVCHRAPDRFDLLYRLLWRLRDEPHLLKVLPDPDVARARDYSHNVSQAVHKMHAYVRFRLVDEARGPEEPETPEAAMPETYVAWFEPPHFVTVRALPFFAKRMANLRFSILTPDLCAHWNGSQVSTTPGVTRDQAPGEDVLEDYWRTYYAGIFNPARLNAKVMTQHMAKHYWRNLPEASLIPELIAAAEGRTAAMVQAPPTAPSPRALKAAAKAERDVPIDSGLPARDLEEVAAGVHMCRRCDLWRDATQGVPGEGPRAAPLMFVGEQPGDLEDLAGRPFVGPAGQLLDRALAAAGVPRADAYVTNAVKHFKHEVRGKRRIHAKPNAGEVKACNWWLENERRLVKPRVVVALGATAATAVFKRTVAVTRERGLIGPLEGGGAQTLGFLTVHPSFLLRLPDEESRAREFDLFVRDLAAAQALLKAA